MKYAPLRDMLMLTGKFTAKILLIMMTIDQKELPYSFILFTINTIARHYSYLIIKHKSVPFSETLLRGSRY